MAWVAARTRPLCPDRLLSGRRWHAHGRERQRPVCIAMPDESPRKRSSTVAACRGSKTHASSGYAAYAAAVAFFLLGAAVFSLKPFLKRRGRSFSYRMRPVPRFFL